MNPTWCLLGLPDDTGVKHVNGRTGAAEGPKRFREFWSRLKGPEFVAASLTDLGDAPVSDDIYQTHEQAAKLLAEQLPKYDFSVIVGGGHDLAYPHLLGLDRAFSQNGKLGCINIDPHFDLRPDQPIFTSGSPFYAALNTELISGENFVEFGIQEQVNAPSLFSFAWEKQVQVVPFHELRNGRSLSVFEAFLGNLAQRTEKIMLSLDLDALQAAFAPGVSAPAAEGFTPSEVIEMVRLAALEPKIVSLGIYELNPAFDIDNRTARLAATVAWHFASVKLQLLSEQNQN